MTDKPAPVRVAPTMSAQPGISVDRLLHQYGKTHLQLVFSEEQLNAARQQVASMEVQLKAALTRLAEQGKALEAYIEKFGTVASIATEEGRKAQGFTLVSEIPLPKAAQETDTASDG